MPVSRLTLQTVLVAALALAACEPPSEHPAQAPTPQASTPSESAPLPPEETAPVESPSLSEAPVDRAPEPGITTTGAPTRGTLPKSAVDATLASAEPAVRGCYERGLRQNPELRGRVTVALVVAPDGTVARAEASDDDGALNHAPTVTCILDELRQLVFPAPRGGPVFLTYPLDLAPPKPTR